MGRRYVRDARGRFASSGYSGQTGGRGARLKAKTERVGGGAKIKAAGPPGTVGKPRGLKPNSIKPKAATQAQKRAPKHINAARPKQTLALRGQSVAATNLQRKAALTRVSQARGAFFNTSYGTSAQSKAKRRLDAAEARFSKAEGKWRSAKMARLDAKPNATPTASFKRTGKVKHLPGKAASGLISKSPASRNRQQREAAFKRRVNRAASNLHSANAAFGTYRQAHKFGNAPGQGVQVERTYRQKLRSEQTAKKALSIYQGTARATVSDSRVYGRPYGMNRPAVSRTSKGYRAPAERLRQPRKRRKP